MPANAWTARLAPRAGNYPSYVVKTTAWRHERDILAKHVPDTDPGAAAWFARESKANPNGSGGS
jgi:hypothetical protein